MSYPEQPITGVRRFPERPLFDEPESFTCLACGDAKGVDGLLCERCTDGAAPQRADVPCTLCGRDTYRLNGVCARCADDPLYRQWSHPEEQP